MATIEQRMKEIVDRDEPIKREVWSREEAIAHFKSIGEAYKAEIIASIPANEDVSLYSEGGFTDLCRGPHVPSTGKLKAFKLTKVAGAYWRGDSRNEMLQRIYGTAWPDKKQLDEYLLRLEEAEKRDHRKIGRELNLFHLQEEAPGAVFWHPRGWTVFQSLIAYMRERQLVAGYQEVNAPELMDASLWQQSGHLEKFGENMFLTKTPDERLYAIKPMNCPGHIQIFNSDLRSYRDLPLRYGEFGFCHRNEASGALHGIMRVRAFVQDDGHIFCTPDDIEAEVTAFNRLALAVYKDFGFEDIAIRLSLRPEKRIGSDAVWDRAEGALRAALKACGVAWTDLPGDGGFYGPKIDYSLRDSLGRSWQCGTMQVDFSMPERLGAEDVAEDNTRKTPVMLHRAIVGSLERFIGILLENHAVALPPWLAPVQAVVLTITENQAPYADEVVKALTARGFRIQGDLRNEKISYKIREHSLQKIPYLLVVGDKEMQAKTVAVRARGGKDLGVMSLDAFAERLLQEATVA